MIIKLSKKKVLQKPNLLNNQTCLGTNQCVFRKEKNKGYLNMNFKDGATNVEYVWMSLKDTSKFNTPGIPQPGLLQTGHPGGVNVFEWQFWAAAGFCGLE